MYINISYDIIQLLYQSRNFIPNHLANHTAPLTCQSVRLESVPMRSDSVLARVSRFSLSLKKLKMVSKTKKSQATKHEAFSPSERSRAVVGGAVSETKKSRIAHAFLRRILCLIFLKIIFVSRGILFRETPPPPLNESEFLVNYSAYGHRRLNGNDTIRVCKE